MADERWTAETEELATARLWEFGHLGELLDDITKRDEPAAVAFTRGAVRAGVLIPVGGETRQKYRIRQMDGRIVEYGRAPSGPTHVRSVTIWPDPEDPDQIAAAWPRYIGPWREVTDDPA